MEQPIAVVTGSSSGFGLEICLEMARRGYFVIATMRDTMKRTKLMNLATEQSLDTLIDIQTLDVTNHNSIKAWSQYMDKIGSVEVLINNAGFARGGFVEEIPIGEYRDQFETNFFGVVAVTQVIIPMMRKARKGKIINVSSISGRIAFPGISPYVASKHALEGWSESLRLEMKPFGIDVVTVEPGSFQTSIWSTGKFVTERSLRPDSPYIQMTRKIENHIEKGVPNYDDPTLVSRLIGDIAQEEGSNFRYPIGKGVRMSIFLKNTLPWKLWEKLILKKLT